MDRYAELARRAVVSMLLEDDECLRVYRGFGIGSPESGAFSSDAEVDEYYTLHEDQHFDFSALIDTHTEIESTDVSTLEFVKDI